MNNRSEMLRVANNVDCFMLADRYDELLVQIIRDLFKEEVETKVGIPVKILGLKEKGLILREDYLRISGLLLEIDGVLEMRVYGMISEDECKKKIEDKYSEVMSILRDKALTKI